jgi:predicted TIM-barrel fold metal-dependent hydrolase
MTVIDADGHVTESQEQIARYLDEPFKRRPVNQFFYPWDGWDRRLLDAFSDLAGTTDAWLKALDRGGMERAVLYPTLGLFMSFLKGRQWAVALCRAYNTFLHEEFVKKTERLQAVALLPVQAPEACAPELRRAVRELGLCGAMLPADGGHLLGDSRYADVYEEAQRLETSSRPSSRPTPARTPSGRCAS